MNDDSRKLIVEDNRLRREDRAVHNWYRFVLSFPPHLVRTYLERFRLNASSRVLDPFCGTGTTIVECQKLGVPSIGLERNPMAFFASRVKANWKVGPSQLLVHARMVAERTVARLRAVGIADGPEMPFFDRGLKAAIGELHSLPAEAAKLLLNDGMDPGPFL